MVDGQPENPSQNGIELNQEANVGNKDEEDDLFGEKTTGEPAATTSPPRY